MAKQQPPKTHLQLTLREIATMLAALRRWQRDLERQGANLPETNQRTLVQSCRFAW